MKPSKKTLTALCLIFATVSYAETYVVDTLGGESLQPIIQNQLNQLPNGGNVMVYQQRLIINTTPQNYRQISQFIRQIDILPQTLTVSVRVGGRGYSHQNTGYGQIGMVNSQVYVNGQWQNNQSQSQSQQFFQIKTLSGKPAQIGLSQLMPTTQIYTRYRNYHPQVWIGKTLLTAEQGISVLPTALPNGQVSLNISQSNGKFSHYNEQTMLNSQQLSNSIVLSPNQWTTIGFISTQSEQNGSYGNVSVNEQLPIEIMVN
nr:hypothetical protein [uncultured Moraxella sp.]